MFRTQCLTELYLSLSLSNHTPFDIQICRVLFGAQSFTQRLHNFFTFWRYQLQDFYHVRPIVQKILWVALVSLGTAIHTGCDSLHSDLLSERTPEKMPCPTVCHFSLVTTALA